MADHIVVTLLALEHGHLQVLHMPPSGLQISLVVSISGKLLGILAPTVSTRPVDLTLLAADLAICSFLPPEFESHFGFQKSCQDGFDGLQGRCFRLLLHCFDDLFAFFSLEMLDRNGYTHRC
jgi:hypothetical protein